MNQSNHAKFARPDLAAPNQPRYSNGMRPTKNGFIIDCAGCAKEFESSGLRCCSTRCETSLSRPKPAKAAKIPKPARLKIVFYTVTPSGHRYWRPSAAYRELGFKSVDCGFDGARDVNRRSNLTLDRRPILTLLSAEYGR
jgi:hypothetical protein